MAQIIDRDGKMILIEDNGTESEYNVGVQEPTEPTDAQINTALILDLYAALEAKGVI